jgi:hypothetical protein
MLRIHPRRGARTPRFISTVPEPGSSDPALPDLAQLTSRQLDGLVGPLLQAVFDGRADGRVLTLLRIPGLEFDRPETRTA